MSPYLGALQGAQTALVKYANRDLRLLTPPYENRVVLKVI